MDIIALIAFASLALLPFLALLIPTDETPREKMNLMHTLATEDEYGEGSSDEPS